MTTNLRSIALDIFHRTLAAIEVEAVIHQALQLNGKLLKANSTTVNLDEFSQVFVIAIGKAAEPMARAAQAILGAKITRGIVATSAMTGPAPTDFQVFIGGHPLPNQSSIDGAEAALQLLQSANDEKTLVLFLISGGGSAVFEKPIDEAISLDDLQAINRVLVGCGAVIGEMNVIRKFLSAVKGGRLANAANRATQISLYISDVNHDDLATISSGLTLPSNITNTEVERILTKYDLLNKFPPHVAKIVQSTDFSRLFPATEKPTEIGTQNCAHHLLLDNRAALQIAQQIAEQDYDCVVKIAADLIEGDVEEMANIHLARLQTLRKNNLGKNVCLLSGGEVVCPVRGNGQGGRNQEFVLRAALNAEQDFPFAVLSAGTDGIDGHSPASGAVADESTIARAKDLQLAPQDYLQRSDSYNFFAALGDAILTGPTGNNVRDLRIFLSQ